MNVLYCDGHVNDLSYSELRILKSQYLFNNKP